MMLKPDCTACEPIMIHPRDKSMSWQEMFLECRVSDEEIIQAVSDVFKVMPQQVVVTHEDPDLREMNKNVAVVCWVDALKRGDFPIMLEIFPLYEELLPKNELEVEGLICEALKCRALVSNDDLSLYSWTLISGKNSYQKVIVDDEELKLDSNDYGFVIVSFE